MGKVAPDKVKPVPVSAAELMVTGAVPVEVNVKDWLAAESTVTSPKLKLPALRVNCGLDAAVPVPLRFTTVDPPLDELLSIVI